MGLSVGDSNLAVSHIRGTRQRQRNGAAWSVLVLAEGGTPDPSYFQIGGAPSRAHVWTEPGYSGDEKASEVG
jgi:hypothetical protein